MTLSPDKQAFTQSVKLLPISNEISLMTGQVLKFAIAETLRKLTIGLLFQLSILIDPLPLFPILCLMLVRLSFSIFQVVCPYPVLWVVSSS